MAKTAIAFPVVCFAAFGTSNSKIFNAEGAEKKAKSAEDSVAASAPLRYKDRVYTRTTKVRIRRGFDSTPIAIVAILQVDSLPGNDSKKNKKRSFSSQQE